MSLQCTNLESSSSQRFSITQAAQTGLDITGDLSVAIGFNTESFGALGDHILGFYDASASPFEGYGVSLTSAGVLRFWDGTSWISTTLTPTHGTWYEVCFTKSGTALKFYNGGTLQDTLVASSTLPSYSGNRVIGGRSSGDRTFDGKLKYVRIWNTELTLGEVSSEVGSATAAKTANLQLDMNFEGNANDSSSNANNFTAINTPTYNNDAPQTDISLYGSVEGTDYVRMTANASEIPSNQTGFVFPLDLSQIDASDNFWTGVSADGSDIRVTNADGTIQYPIFISPGSFDKTNKKGLVHIRADAVSTGNDFRVYYNGTSAKRDVDALYGQYEVAGTDYYFWWDGGDLNDATQYQNNLTAFGGVTAGGVDGLLGKATDFDGSNDYMTAPDGADSDIGTEDFTLQAITKRDSASFMPFFNKGERDGHSVAWGMDLHSDNGFGGLVQDNTTNGVFYSMRSDGATHTQNTTDWYVLAIVCDRTTPYLIYQDGVSLNDGSEIEANTAANQDGSLTNSLGINIGRRAAIGTPSYTNGKLQHLRARKGLLDADWLSMEASAFKTPATFWTYNSPSVDVTVNIGTLSVTTTQPVSTVTAIKNVSVALNTLVVSTNENSVTAVGTKNATVAIGVLTTNLTVPTYTVEAQAGNVNVPLSTLIVNTSKPSVTIDTQISTTVSIGTLLVTTSMPTESVVVEVTTNVSAGIQSVNINMLPVTVTTERSTIISLGVLSMVASVPEIAYIGGAWRKSNLPSYEDWSIQSRKT